MRNPVGGVVTNDTAKIKIQDIKDLYEQAEALVDASLPNTNTSTLYISSTAPNATNTSSEILVFVHGWNMQDLEKSRYAETAYKRLYWAGYNGRLATFSWPTLTQSWLTLAPAGAYNESEWRAWKSGKALRDYLNYMRTLPRLAGYTASVAAHSMGNVVTGEALKEGANVDNYVMMQAAISATCYDGSTALYQENFVNKDLQPGKQTPLDAAQMGYRLHLDDVGVNRKFVNFYNTNDFALVSGTWHGMPANWEANNLSYKPDDFYWFDGVNCHKDIVVTVRLVTDPFEVMGFVSRSRSKAVGAEPRTAGPVNTALGVDLAGEFGFGRTRPDHSGQFTRNIQVVVPFYSSLKDVIKP